MPKQYTVLDSVRGDLDKDGSLELVVACNTLPVVDSLYESIPRELIIYKKAQGKWTIWQRSKQALKGSRDGGMMGDPYGEMWIRNGVLGISHEGGSSWKWNETDKYRYDKGVFQLIGYSTVYGKLCEYWADVDFNLVTGKLVIKKEYEDCEKNQEVYKRENETFYKKGLRISLQERNEREIKFVTPKYKHKVYIAVKDE